ncbi:MAG: type II toxin-antitoxin system HicB family antitoxin [Treponema sp.]|jgi:predicted RNase H-like HicB family nuclease|nr:type II toxin-antitoxin system HicB family antitoxin [Treponema sp.]
MELHYTYWQEKDGWFLGYLNDYPSHWTQGKTIKELEEMLADLYELGPAAERMPMSEGSPPVQEEQPETTPE